MPQEMINDVTDVITTAIEQNQTLTGSNIEVNLIISIIL